jgi:hypothetical protein
VTVSTSMAIAENIRSLYASGVKASEISEKFGISFCTARRIINNQVCFSDSYYPDIAEADHWRSVFWGKVDKRGPDDCWEWKAHTQRRYGNHVMRFEKDQHYGRTTLNGKRCLSHRAAFFYANGRHAEGLVCHTCDNPPCCNPKHLVEGTHKDNAMDAARKGRSAILQAKLTPDQVREIRGMRGNGMSSRRVAAKFGVVHSTVLSIQNNTRWRDI